MPDRTIELTRRNVLLTAGTIGLAGSGAGLGTSALFTDEESFSNNAVTAGTLDLGVTARVVDASEYFTESGAGPTVIGEIGTADGTVITGLQLADMKPGDWVILCFEISVEDNPGYVRVSAENFVRYENGQTEPEIAVEGDDGNAGGSLGMPLDGQGAGELQNELLAEIYGSYDETSSSNPPRSYLSQGDPSLSGTAEMTVDQFASGVVLGSHSSPTRVGSGPDAAEQYLLLYLPESVDNRVQSDAIAFDLVFETEQARNNDDPFGTESVPDAISIEAQPTTAGETDSVHRVEVPVGSDIDGTTLSSLTVDYPSDFDGGNVGPADVLGAGVQHPDNSITHYSVTGTSSSDGDTAVTFTVDSGPTVSAGETIFLEFRNMTNASTDDDYTVVVDVNGTEIGPGSLTITPTTPTQPITTTFETDEDGWEITGDAQGASSVPNYESEAGNPAPSISAIDDVQGGVWYFEAPGKYLADKSDYYGGTLEYDLKQEIGSPNQFNAKDVVLEGGGETLEYDHGGHSTHPGGPDFEGWTSYSVTLDESDNWTYSGSSLTQSEFEAVLGDLTRLRIRGEYQTGDDTGYLDNVRMDPPQS